MNRQKQQPKIKSYSTEDLNKAITAVKNGELSYKKASQLYRIPRSTLIARCKGWKNRPASGRDRPGRVPDLSQETEAELAQHLETLNNWGFGLSRKEVLNTVGVFVQQNNINTRFKNGVPKKDWFIGFCKRHHLSCKKPIKRQSIRTEQTTPDVIDGFFDLYEETIKDLKLLDRPHLIFNLDETSLCSDPSNTKVVAQKNKPVFRHTHGTGRSNTSILFCVSACGDKLPPFILYKAKNLWDAWMPEEAFPHTGYAATPHGWMTENAFYSWFKTHFLKFCPKERPLLLLFDGHTSHVSISLIKLAKEENICLLKLPPHTTHVLQPLDAIPFGSFKKNWDEEVSEWQRAHYGIGMSKAEFSILVGKVWSNMSGQLIKRSFQVTGLYDENRPNENPINRKVIKTSNVMSIGAILDQSPLTSVSKDNTEPACASTSRDTTDTTDPACASTSKDTAEFNKTTVVKKVSFEELLLKKIARPTSAPVKKRKVLNSNLADVITRDDYLKQLEQSVAVRKQKQVPKRKKLELVESESNASDLDYETSHSDDTDEYEGISSLNELVEAEDENDDNSFDNSIKVGSWIIATYATKKTIRHFLGKVLEVLDGTVKATFLRKKGEYFIWPNVPDLDTIRTEDVLRVIPPPIEERRGRLRFSLQFDGLSVQ